LVVVLEKIMLMVPAELVVLVVELQDELQLPVVLEQ
jgi:hypothetical protein